MDLGIVVYKNLFHFSSEKTQLLTRRNWTDWLIKQIYRCTNWFDSKWSIPGLFFVYFVFSNKHNNVYNKFIGKNYHPVYGARIRTHDLQDISSSHNHKTMAPAQTGLIASAS